MLLDRMLGLLMNGAGISLSALGKCVQHLLRKIFDLEVLWQGGRKSGITHRESCITLAFEKQVKSG